jgi:CRP-like cAMP-binding protein
VQKNGQSISVASLTTGDCFGEMSLLTGERRSATVHAKGDCFVMEIGKEVMGEVIRESPECLRQLSEILAERRLETEGIVKEAAGAGDHAARQREYRATFLARLQKMFTL